MLAPQLEAAAEQLGDAVRVFKIDSDKEEAMASSLRVRQSIHHLCCLELASEQLLLCWTIIDCDCSGRGCHVSKQRVSNCLASVVLSLAHARSGVWPPNAAVHRQRRDSL